MRVLPGRSACGQVDRLTAAPNPRHSHSVIGKTWVACPSASQHLEDHWRELVAGGASEDDATRLTLAGFRDGNLGYGPNWFKDILDGNAVVQPLREEIVGDARQPLLIVFGTVGFVSTTLITVST